METMLWDLLRYDDWANRATLQALQNATATERSKALFAHTVAAEWLWLDRLRSQPQSVAVWPDWDLTESARRLDDLLHSWRTFLDAVQDLDAPVRYTNSKGEAWTSRAREVVTHVVLHSAYHRGQIAQDSVGAGQEAAYTDYIHCARQGLLD